MNQGGGAGEVGAKMGQTERQSMPIMRSCMQW